MAHPRRVVALLLALSACGGTEPAMRNLTVADQLNPGADIRLVAPRYTVDALDIRIPRTLVVSETNSFHPMADIVWRGEPPGDRYDQIADIFADAMETGIFHLQSGPHVRVTVELARFHALTEKARNTVGGVHSVHYMLTVRDATTGAVVDGPRLVKADVKASGGAGAIAEERIGRTQRVVIVEALSQSILRELSQDGGPASVSPQPVQNPS